MTFEKLKRDRPDKYGCFFYACLNMKSLEINYFNTRKSAWNYIYYYTKHAFLFGYNWNNEIIYKREYY